MVVEIMVGTLLCVQSVWDIKRKCIPSYITVLGAGVGVLCSIYKERSLVEVVLALLPGIMMLLLGKLTREAVGYGDGLLITCLGTFYALEDVAYVCMGAFLFAAGMALVMLVFGNRRKEDSFPFVPFLFLGWILWLLLMKGVV